MRDPEQVARAQHAAARLESAWERWRSLQGLADTPAQPVVGYVGYALKEPWGQPRAVIGFSADEAERLAEFLEHGNAEGQQSPQSPASAVPQPSMKSSGSSGSGPQPTFTPVTAAVPSTAVPPPAAQRQTGQRHAPAHATSTRTSARSQKSPAKSAQAPSPEAKPAAAAEAQKESSHAKAPKEPSHAKAIPEQASRADLAADRSLRGSYPVPRVDSASYQEPVRHLKDRGRSA